MVQSLKAGSWVPPVAGGTETWPSPSCTRSLDPMEVPVLESPHPPGSSLPTPDLKLAQLMERT